MWVGLSNSSCKGRMTLTTWRWSQKLKTAVVLLCLQVRKKRDVKADEAVGSMSPMPSERWRLHLMCGI